MAYDGGMLLGSGTYAPGRLAASEEGSMTSATSFGTFRSA